jgi:hypothetical protein
LSNRKAPAIRTIDTGFTNDGHSRRPSASAQSVATSTIDKHRAKRDLCCGDQGGTARVDARQLIGGAAFAPNELKAIFEAFDDAWNEVAADVSTRASAVEAARLSLATIVLKLAAVGPIERARLQTAAVHAFRRKHRIRS